MAEPPNEAVPVVVEVSEFEDEDTDGATGYARHDRPRPTATPVWVEDDEEPAVSLPPPAVQPRVVAATPEAEAPEAQPEGSPPRSGWLSRIILLLFLALGATLAWYLVQMLLPESR